MEGVFGMDTGTVRQTGGAIVNSAEEFQSNRQKINNIINDLTQYSYTSSAAGKIQDKIVVYDETLNKIQNKLEAHGEFGKWASRTTLSSNDEIKNMIDSNLGDI